jgi:hypothetical protein
MTISMVQLDTKFTLRHAHFHAAHAALLHIVRALPREIDHVSSKRLLETSHLVEALRTFRWRALTEDRIDLSDVDPVNLRGAGRHATKDILDLEFSGTQLGDDRLMFEALAPFVEAGSYVSMRADDTNIWRWYFDGKKCHEQPARITYEDAPTEPTPPEGNRLSEVASSFVPWKRQAGEADPDLTGADEISLRTRAGWAEEALRCYAAKAGLDYDDESERELAVEHLLGDIQHFCDREDFEYDLLAATAEEHYTAEIDGGSTGDCG